MFSYPVYEIGGICVGVQIKHKSVCILFKFVTP